MNSKIPATIGFNKPHLTGKELHYIADAHGRGQLAGDGVYTQRCSERLEEITGSPKALLTHSCTAALEMSAILVDINPGDEIIMPSYTFVSTANAFVLRGGVPVFVDIRADTLNIDEMQIESAITPRTRAIVVVHYAGVACEMDVILDIAARHKLWVIEDAAQAVLARYKGRALGSIGHLGAFSFHETKNVISGEGGALLINDRRLISRAEVIREKGTNRSQFFLGQVDKYTWVDVGSSFLPGEINAAFLWAQLEEAEQITRKRINLWDQYHLAFQPLEDEGLLRRPTIPITCQHNAHMYYLILQDRSTRDKFISKMHHESINCVFHYVPLHSSPASQRYSRTSGHLPITTRLADCLVRLPLWIGLDEHQVRVINAVRKILS